MAKKLQLFSEKYLEYWKGMFQLFMISLKDMFLQYICVEQNIHHWIIMVTEFLYWLISRYKNPRSRQFLCFPDENNSALMVPVDKKISKIAILTAKNSGQTSKSSVCVYRAERRGTFNIHLLKFPSIIRTVCFRGRLDHS